MDMDSIKNIVKHRFMSGMSDMKLDKDYKGHNGLITLEECFDIEFGNMIDVLSSYKNECELLKDNTSKTLESNVSIILHEISILKIFSEFKSILGIPNLNIKYEEGSYYYFRVDISFDKLEKEWFCGIRNKIRYGLDINSKTYNIHKELYSFLVDIFGSRYSESFFKDSNPRFNNDYDYRKEVIKSFCAFWSVTQTNDCSFGMLSFTVDKIWHYLYGNTKLYNYIVNKFGGKFILHNNNDVNSDFNNISYDLDLLNYSKLLETINDNFGDKINLNFDIFPCPISYFKKNNVENVIDEVKDNLVYSIKLDGSISKTDESNFYRYLLNFDVSNLNRMILKNRLASKIKRSEAYVSKENPYRDYRNLTPSKDKKIKWSQEKLNHSKTPNGQTHSDYNPTSTDSGIDLATGLLLGSTISSCSSSNSDCSSHSSHSSCSTSSCSSSSCSSGSSCSSCSC